MGSAPLFWRKPNYLYYWLPPVLWGLALLCLSGDLGSGTNTRGKLEWLFSWLVDLEPAQIDSINFYLEKPVTSWLTDSWVFSGSGLFGGMRATGRGAPVSGLWGFVCSFLRWTRGANGFTPPGEPVSAISSWICLLLPWRCWSLPRFGGPVTMPSPEPESRGGKHVDRNNLCEAPLKSNQGEFTLNL